MNNTLQIIGTITHIYEPQTIVTQGQMTKQQFVIMTDEGKFSRNICFSVINNRVNLANFKTGDLVNVVFDLESREWKEKYYTEAKAWSVALYNEQKHTPNMPSDAQSKPQQYSDIPDSLPF